MSVTLETLDKIKLQLKEAKDTGSVVKHDLYTHLTEVFNRIMLHHPYNAFDKFEEISQLVKQTHLKIQDPKFDHEVNRIRHQENDPAKAQWLQKSKNLFMEIVDIVPKHDAGLLTRNKTFTIPDFCEEAEMLEWAGIGFGEDEVYKITKSIKVTAI